MNLEEIKSRIQESHEAQIGISFFFTDLTSIKVIFAEITQIETVIHSMYDVMINSEAYKQLKAELEEEKRQHQNDNEKYSDKSRITVRNARRKFPPV